VDSFEGVVLLSSEPRKCKDHDGSEKQKKAVCKYQNGDIAEAPILEAYGEKDSQSDDHAREQVAAAECTPPNSKTLVRIRRNRSGTLLGVAVRPRRGC
jgi:hypothetical protein